ncbi:MAG: HPP family protein [Actinomycetota bacterium]|nr:HPP family protein [Actinomycetota bacterium]
MTGRRIFRPLLAGANARDRAFACAGVIAGITLIALCGMMIDGPIEMRAWVFAPVGASAVLLFVVPSSPLTQPWPVIGGSLMSGGIGILAGTLIANQALAVGLAVGLAIAAMSLTRSLHPPGGSFAITGVLGVPAAASVDSLLPLVLVAFDTVAIVLLAMAYHRLVTGHSYPHVTPAVLPEPAVPARETPAWQVRFGPQDVDSVLARMDDTFDISRGDLEAILRAVEDEALDREYGHLTDADGDAARQVVQPQ